LWESSFRGGFSAGSRLTEYCLPRNWKLRKSFLRWDNQIEVVATVTQPLSLEEFRSRYRGTVPDVIGTLKSSKDYPTQPMEIVVEILSPEDKLLHVMKKCQQYERIGTERIFVLDPVDKLAWRWKAGSLEAITQLLLTNGAAVALEEIWRQLEEQG